MESPDAGVSRRGASPAERELVLPEIVDGSPNAAKHRALSLHGKSRSSVSLFTVSTAQSNASQNSRYDHGNGNSKERLAELSTQLAEVRRQRMEHERVDLDPAVARRQEKERIRFQKEKEKREAERKRLKHSFFHPKLDIVMAELVHSPYNTKPQIMYKQETFRMHDKLCDLRRSGIRVKDLPQEERPFDVKETKQKFIEDVVKYQVNFTMTGQKESKARARSQCSSLAVSRAPSLSRTNTAKSLAPLAKQPSLRFVSPSANSDAKAIERNIETDTHALVSESYDAEGAAAHTERHVEREHVAFAQTHEDEQERDGDGEEERESESDAVWDALRAVREEFRELTVCSVDAEDAQHDERVTRLSLSPRVPLSSSSQESDARPLRVLPPLSSSPRHNLSAETATETKAMCGRESDAQGERETKSEIDAEDGEYSADDFDAVSPVKRSLKEEEEEDNYNDDFS